jgi:hypothetical protein
MIDAGNHNDLTIALTIPKCYVPGQPYVSLDDEKGVNENLKKRLRTKDWMNSRPFFSQSPSRAVLVVQNFPYRRPEAGEDCYYRKPGTASGLDL